MKIAKIFIFLVIINNMAFAVDGYSVYKDKCQKCHVEMMDAKEAMKNMGTLKAPPMLEVSIRLKEMINLKADDEEVKRELVMTFIRDYVIHPDIEKSMCRMGAIDKFGVMPSLKGKLTDEELHSVAQWVYDRYEGMKF